MRYIRVNVTDNSGNRSSTTINAQIAKTWGAYHGISHSVDSNEYYKQLTKALRGHITTFLKGFDKSEIECLLMQDIERKIIERERQKNKQPNLL